MSTLALVPAPKRSAPRELALEKHMRDGTDKLTVTCSYQIPPATPPNPGAVLPDITLAVSVGATAHGVFNNVAVVATPGDNNPANDTAVDPTIVE